MPYGSNPGGTGNDKNLHTLEMRESLADSVPRRPSTSDTAEALARPSSPPNYEVCGVRSRTEHHRRCISIYLRATISIYTTSPSASDQLRRHHGHPIEISGWGSLLVHVTRAPGFLTFFFFFFVMTPLSSLLCSFSRLSEWYTSIHSYPRWA